MAIASPKAVIMIAVVIISGLSAAAASPDEPALPTANPAPIAEAEKAIAAPKNLAISEKPPDSSSNSSCANAEVRTIEKAAINKRTYLLFILKITQIRTVGL